MELLSDAVRSDRVRLDALLDPEFIEIGASGRTWDKDETIAELLAAAPLNVAVSHLTARQVADHVVLLT